MVSVVIRLHEHSSCGKEGGVGHNSEWARDVGDQEDGGRGKYLLESLKGILL